MSIRDKFISESGIKVVLESLREWFPFIKKSFYKIWNGCDDCSMYGAFSFVVDEK